MSRRSGLLAGLTGLTAAVALTACSGAEQPDDAAPAGHSSVPSSSSSSSGSPGPSTSRAEPSPTDPAEAAYQPCEGLKARQVTQALGAPVREDRGTPDVPRCALVPDEEGDAVLDANYLVFPAGLDAAWDSMGAPDDGSTTEPEIPGADAARLVVGVADDTLTVSGFVQNGELIQLVNAVDPAPYDEAAVTRAVETMMVQLSAYAAENGPT